ncbi:MAG: rhodanese-like domain-containing protein [Fimbriimonadaceae bacterium]
MSQTISPSDLRSKLDSGSRFQLIDVRSPQEFAAGHLPCAVNVPMEQVESRTADLNSIDPIVLVCQSGTRASITCAALQSKRHDLVVLTGGTSAWQEAGLPLVGSSRTKLPLIRQVHLVAGMMVVIGAVLALTVNLAWLYLCAFVGAGLTIAGATGFCGMGIILGAMPWNRPKSGGSR